MGALVRNGYNLDVIEFLLKSFVDMSNNFGRNSNTVKFFKQQVRDLINIGQVSTRDVDIVYKLTSTQNTDNIQWDTVLERIRYFRTIIKAVESNSICRRWEYAKKVISDQKITSRIISSTLESIYKQVDLKPATSYRSTTDYRSCTYSGGSAGRIC